MSHLVRLAGALALVATCLPVASVSALSYPVTSTADTEDKGTLRASIKEANAHTGPDTIPIEVTGTINLQSALQIIFDPVSIVGPGADQLEIHRSAATGFSVLGFATDANGSSVTGVTVSNGQAALGGGIRNAEGSLTLTGIVVRQNEAVAEGDTNTLAEGGGIFSEGSLTVRESRITGNAARARDGIAQTFAFGGGISSLTALTVERSTIDGNVAEATGGDDLTVAQGGGLVTGSPTTIELSTISGNSASAEDGGTNRAMGGGIKAYEANLDSSTVNGNSATSGELAFGANFGSFVTSLVRNSIISGPEGDADSCEGEIASGGFNLDEDDSCGFDESSDLVGVIAGLGPLADNGGPTPTHALLAGSIAIDRGNSFGSSVDQRGLPRPSDFADVSNKEGGDGGDIGAFERQAPMPPPGGGPVLVSEVPTDRTPPNTRIVSGPPRVTFKTKAKFRFASTEAQSHFQCRLEKKRWKPCSNPFKGTVKPGKHLFKVRAIDRFGNVDPTPARFGWRVKPIAG